MQVLTVDLQQPDAQERFTRSLKETGFAVLTNHPFPWQQIENIYAQWQQFFADDRRLDYYFSEQTQDGYFPPDIAETAKGADTRDLKEFYQLYFPHGRYPSFISNETYEYFNSAITFGVQLVKWIEQALPEHIRNKIERPLHEMVSAEHSMLRILHYPAQNKTIPKGAIRAAAHEDINLITLLPAATEPGLQVRARSGEWLPVQVDPKSLVVNIGDMLEEATGHYYRSTTHRVVNPEADSRNKARMSIPLFVHPEPDVRLSARYTAGSYLRERLTELGHITD